MCGVRPSTGSSPGNVGPACGVPAPTNLGAIVRSRAGDENAWHPDHGMRGRERVASYRGVLSWGLDTRASRLSSNVTSAAQITARVSAGSMTPSM